MCIYIYIYIRNVHKLTLAMRRALSGGFVLHSPETYIVMEHSMENMLMKTLYGHLTTFAGNMLLQKALKSWVAKEGLQPGGVIFQYISRVLWRTGLWIIDIATSSYVFRSRAASKRSREVAMRRNLKTSIRQSSGSRDASTARASSHNAHARVLLYHFNNLRFKQAQRINDFSAARIVFFVVSSEHMRCRLLKLIVRPPYESGSFRRFRCIDNRGLRATMLPCVKRLPVALERCGQSTY